MRRYINPDESWEEVQSSILGDSRDQADGFVDVPIVFYADTRTVNHLVFKEGMPLTKNTGLTFERGGVSYRLWYVLEMNRVDLAYRIEVREDE